ncbi:hypothetical protein AMECASPLE_027558 [Ameca splendens]|uniref:Uncharacterized protein n=1 Tax=Ameca splendens TaxID=208324 RepID=A0ABV0Z349_9TELE
MSPFKFPVHCNPPWQKIWRNRQHKQNQAQCEQRCVVEEGGDRKALTHWTRSTFHRKKKQGGDTVNGIISTNKDIKLKAEITANNAKLESSRRILNYFLDLTGSQ